MAKSYKNYNILASGTELKGVNISVSGADVNVDNLITILTGGDYDITLTAWKDKQAPNGVNALLTGKVDSSDEEPAF